MTEKTTNIISFAQGRDLKIRTLQAKIEDVIEEFIEDNNISIACAVGVLEVIKSNLIEYNQPDR